jgi:ligand-binding sensor domain-containing protein
VSTFDGSAWTPYRLPDVNLSQYRFLSIHHDLEGTCYLGTDEGTIFILSRDAVRELIIPQGFPSKYVMSVQRFGPALWFLTEGSIYRLEEDLTEVTPPLEWCSGTMTDIFVGDDEEMWVTTRFGVLHFDGRSWNLFDRRQGLPTEHFVSLSSDPWGSLWFASFDRGVLEFTGREWIHYTERNGLPQNRIGSLVVDGSGYPWILTADGALARYSKERWEEAVLPDRQETGADSSGARQDTLMQLDPGIRFLAGRDGETPGGARSRGNVLGLDASGNCLLARPDGVFRLTVNGWQVIDPPRQASGFEPTTIIGTSRGEIWVGTESDGIYVRRQGEWFHIGTSRELTDGHIRTLCEDNSGSLWIGTLYGGVTKVTP